MANYSSLKNALAQVIKPNDNQEITGQIMQDALMAMINALGAGYQFAGVPTAQTDPSTPDQNVFYIAGAGTYPNFGATKVPQGSIGVFRYNGSWDYSVLDVASWADASNKLYYNTQAGNVAAKIIQADGFTLQPGGWLKVHFDNANTVDNPTLNVNNTGAHTMTFNGRPVSATNSWKAGETVAFYYDNYGVGIWRGIRLVELPDFINVNELVGQTTPFASASAARSAIPQQNRKAGLNIAYLLSTGENTSQWVQDMYIGDDVTDWGVADNWKVVGPVSVSQNMETGHTDIKIGNTTTPVASVEEVSQLGQDVGEYVFELSKLNDLTQFVGTGVNLTPTETKQGYYNIQTKQWVNTSAFTFKIYSVQDGKYYDVLNKASGLIVATIVLFKNNEPIYFGQYTDNLHIKLVATGCDEIGLNYPSSALTEYDAIGLVIPANSIVTNAIVNNAVTTKKLQDNSVTIDKIEFKYLIEGANRANPATCELGYIEYYDGTLHPISQRYATDFIPVSQNGLYCGGVEAYGSSGYGAVYDSNKNYIRGIWSPSYEYQDGDGYVRWTVSVTSVETPNLYVIEGTQEGSYTPYVAPKQVIKKEYIPELDSSNIEDGAVTTEKIANNATIPAMLPALSLCGKDCIKVTADSIAASGNLQTTAFPRYLKGNAIVSFYGKISNFDDITLGFGSGDDNSIQIKIDDTNIYRYKSGSLIGSGTPHGLTISDFIDITFNNDIFGISVVLASVSGLFKHTFAEYVSLESYGYPRVELGTTTTVINAELRATSPYFSKPIWVFGDSYTSLYDVRWTKQMIKTIGITDFLLDGLAGGSSGQIYGEVTKALNYGTPKFLIWCLGMNDTYANWNTNYQALKTLCESKGIELILQTIPIPNLETSQQQADINTAIKASGLRYIDACAAMCPNNTWPWYTGYCADGVHPTELGAKVLAARFLSDFPEFMQ